MCLRYLHKIFVKGMPCLYYKHIIRTGGDDIGSPEGLHTNKVFYNHNRLFVNNVLTLSKISENKSIKVIYSI